VALRAKVSAENIKMKLNNQTKNAIKLWLKTSEFLDELSTLKDNDAWVAVGSYLLECASKTVLETFAKDYNQIALPHYMHQFFIGIPKKKEGDIAVVERTQMFIDICYRKGDL
jgi:hypothetical protein